MAAEQALNASVLCHGYPSPQEAVGSAATDDQLSFARNFVHRLQRDGFVRLCNHGINAISIEQVFQAVRNNLAKHACIRLYPDSEQTGPAQDIF